LPQGSAHGWRVVLYTSAAVCFAAGASFALFAGGHRPAGTGSQSADLTAHSRTPPAQDPSRPVSVDSPPRPYQPLMTQDRATPARRVDVTTVTDNHVNRRASQPDLSSAVESAPSTRSQLISIV